MARKLPPAPVPSNEELAALYERRKRGNSAPVPSEEELERRLEMRHRRSIAAPAPSPEALAALYAARKKGNPAAPPTAQDEENRRRNREESRSPAPPPQRVDKEESCCGKCRYMVTGPKIVHGAKKGDVVTLCDNGATRALVLAGHLILVVEEEKDLTAESAGEIEEADNG